MLQKALNSRLGRADNKRFLEQFRYIIVASQLLNDHAYHGPPSHRQQLDGKSDEHEAPQLGALTISGAVLTAILSFGLVGLLQWVRGASTTSTVFRRIGVVFIIVAAVTTLAYTYVRRQWLHYLRRRNLAEVSVFVARVQDLDASITAGITLIQEVELVSRGYRV